RRRARDPIALRKHADDLAMRMLADLPRQRPPIGLGHPVLGLDELVIRNARLEGLKELRVLEILDLRRLLKLGCVHEWRCSVWLASVQISRTLICCRCCFCCLRWRRTRLRR